jgi:hypothetical protein
VRINELVLWVLSLSDLFLPKDVVQQHMPDDFKRKFPDTRMILDATEVRIQKPSKVDDQRATWSSYKNNNTLKTMVGTRYVHSYRCLTFLLNNCVRKRRRPKTQFFLFL